MLLKTKQRTAIRNRNHGNKDIETLLSEIDTLLEMLSKSEQVLDIISNQHPNIVDEAKKLFEKRETYLRG